MKYDNVCIDALGYTIPEEIVTSDNIEARLEPLYTRLRLPEGRLELISGIRERRLWAKNSVPSDQSIRSAEQALRSATVDREAIGALIHASVCRDHLEPATACRVHNQLGLPDNCLIYDVSNACLGLLNGIVQLANMIELGQIRAGMVVGTESSRSLLETTIHQLNRDTSLTRDNVKLAFASLTIGSGSCAVVVADRKLSSSGNRLLGGTAKAYTTHHELCHSGSDEAGGDAMRPLMTTDSETLMNEGIATGVQTFERFINTIGWARKDIHKTFCHQVGAAHRRLLFDQLQLDPAIDFPTVQMLGNTGSVALPISMAMGIENGHLGEGDHVALLGIGSGINCLMLAVHWQGD